jgi:hypothetical protein
MFAGTTLIFFRQVGNKVARWFIFKPKIPIWINFGGYCNGRCWYILGPFGIVNGNLVHFSRFGLS